MGSNLVKNEDRTPEELRAITSRGGKASGEARRRKKAFRQILNAMLENPAKESELCILEALGVPADQANQKALVMASLLIEAKAGDVRAIQEIQRISGEDITEKLKQERLKLDREILEYQKQINPMFSNSSNEQPQAIADLINSPVKGRSLNDFLGKQEDKPREAISDEK